jgi:dolichol-phosphate mannosyltransferase
MPLEMLSVVIPLHNEAGNVAPLVAEIRAALAAIPHEIVLINDGSTDGTPEEAQLTGACVISHRKACGQSAALLTGIRAAQGEWVVTLDGDGQNDPADIPGLWQKTMEFDASGVRVMVMGERTRRQDSAARRWMSRTANRIRESLLHDGVRDTGCSLKIFRRADFLALPFFDHIHRYMPALMRREGIVTHAYPVNHRPRTRGISKYGFWDRLWVGIADLLGVYWLLQRRKLPEVAE